jgi:hypothetical protein
LAIKAVRAKRKEAGLKQQYYEAKAKSLGKSLDKKPSKAQAAAMGAFVGGQMPVVQALLMNYLSKRITGKPMKARNAKMLILSSLPTAALAGGLTYAAAREGYKEPYRDLMRLQKYDAEVKAGIKAKKPKLTSTREELAASARLAPTIGASNLAAIDMLTGIPMAVPSAVIQGDRAANRALNLLDKHKVKTPQ